MAASGLEPLHLRLPHRGEIVDRPTAVSPHCPISDPPARFLPIGRPRLSTPGDASAESPSTPPMRLREKGVRRTERCPYSGEFLRAEPGRMGSCPDSAIVRFGVGPMTEMWMGPMPQNAEREPPLPHSA